MEEQIRLSVRQLVEFILRSGNLDNRFSGFDRAALGSKIHRRLQKAAGEGYHAEVVLSLSKSIEEVSFLVEGRADGIFTQDNQIIVDEIKTTSIPLELIDESISSVHWAQTKCYAYFYCIKNNLDLIGIQLTYFNIETEQTLKKKIICELVELEVFYDDLLKQYVKWAKLEMGWKKTRNHSVKKLDFPFTQYRQGQRALAVAVYKTICSQLKLFCQAPTGIGKTISTLFPAVKALGEEKASKIFYLTAKTITRQSAENALLLLRKSAPIRLKSITLTAKDKICFQSETNCNPDGCEYAKGHFDRVNQAIYELLMENDSFTPTVIENCAKKHEVCPFELSLDLSMWCDCIICDYNYAFDPQVKLKRFFSEGKGDFILLIDEAHNLVDRSREMFSAGLLKSGFFNFKKLLDKKESLLCPILTKINQEMIIMRKTCLDESFTVLQKPPEQFQKLLYQFNNACEQWLDKNKKSELQPMLLQLYFNTLSYLKISELYDSHYVTFISVSSNEVEIRLLCLDPSLLLKQCMSYSKSVILFSATLTPLSYFISVLGGDESSKKLLLPSPFLEEKRALIVADYVSTKYKNRELSLAPIAEIIYQTVSQKTGNYMVYFPSYRYRNDVFEIFMNEHSNMDVVLQQTKMTEKEKEEFLNQFSETNKETHIAFCVLGGIYSEGIDLKGDRLIGSIIIGVGLPQISPEQDVLKDYYEEHNNMGFEYAYQYPGMNKVLQAAGRVIRDESDSGIIVLIDERFSSSSYRSLFPSHWQSVQTVHSTASLKSQLNLFWEKSKN